MTDPAYNPDNFPAMQEAQAFVLPSYQWMIARTEAADSRLNSMITFVAMVTFAIPAFAKSLVPAITFNDGSFLTALLFAIVAASAGIIARRSGGVTLAHPTTIFEKWLSDSVWDFQRKALYFAGKHFEANAKSVRNKANVLTGMTLALLAELGLFAYWLLSAYSSASALP